MKVLLPVALLCLFAFTPPSHCREFMKGKFLLHSGQPGLNYVFTRTDNTQTRYDKRDNSTIFWRVVWTGDCTYDIYYTGQRNRKDSADLNRFKNLPLHFTINKIENKYCLYTATTPGTRQTSTDTLWKVQ